MILQGKVAMITGTGRGLGAALMNELRSRGVTVIGCGLHSDEYPVDVRSENKVHTIVDDVIKKNGHIDILIHNAGWSPRVKSLETVTNDEFSQCMDTNVKGAFTMMKAVLPSMKKRNSGCIITICSRAGSRAHPGLTVYSAAKYAERALTQGLARELQEAGTAIRCMSISPGGIATDMREELFGEEDRAKQQSPAVVALLIADVIEDTPRIPHGADVHIVRGAIATIKPMDDY